MLHGGFDALPGSVLEHLARQTCLATALSRAGFAVAYPQRRSLLAGAGPRLGHALEACADIEGALARLASYDDLGLELDLVGRRPDSGALQSGIRGSGTPRSGARRPGAGRAGTPRSRARSPILFGSSGGADLAFELAARIPTRALIVEEPATVVLTRVLEKQAHALEQAGFRDLFSDPASSAWTPARVWPADLERYFDPARRRFTASVLGALACPTLLLRGDQPLLGAAQHGAIDRLLLPLLLEAYGAEERRAELWQRVYPGREHGFAFAAGADPAAPVPEPAVERLVADVLAFLDAALGAAEVTSPRSPGCP